MNLRKITFILLFSIICVTTGLSQIKIRPGLRVGTGVTFASGSEGIGASFEVPLEILKFLEVSPSVSYSRIKPNYKTTYSHRTFSNHPSTISYNGKVDELGQTSFYESTQSQFGIDLNLRIKPISWFKEKSRIDIALGTGYGYKSGMNVNESSMTNGEYWIKYRSWSFMDWNPILFDVNYKLNDRHKLGLHFNSYGGNDGYDELGIHFITIL